MRMGTNNATALLLTDGIVVTEHKLVPGPNGVPVLKKRTFTHYVILTDVAADTPANRALSKALSHAARLGCPYCTLRGVPGPSGRGMYFCGYCHPVPYGMYLQPSFDNPDRPHFCNTSVCIAVLLQNAIASSDLGQ